MVLVRFQLMSLLVLKGTEKAMMNLYQCHRFPPHDLNQGLPSTYNAGELSTRQPYSINDIGTHDSLLKHCQNVSFYILPCIIFDVPVSWFMSCVFVRYVYLVPSCCIP